MKRIGEMGSTEIGKWLILVSQNSTKMKKSKDDIFECKTCKRRFSSFQALGGHRASHKKPKLLMNNKNHSKAKAETTAKKMHECSICGVEFALGQALGGHMRRHRASSSLEATNHNNNHHHQLVSKLPVLRRSSSCKRVFGLDLNLTPLENDLHYLFGNMAPKVHLFL